MSDLGTDVMSLFHGFPKSALGFITISLLSHHDGSPGGYTLEQGDDPAELIRKR